jgi:hypothetical protein
LPIPVRERIWLTVESAMFSVSAISGPVKRSLRNATIAAIRSAGV